MSVRCRANAGKEIVRRFIALAACPENGQDLNGITDQINSVLLTTSCTTGWLDWVHGELWLCPDGLLRLSLRFRATIAKSSGGAAAFEEFARQQSPRTITGDGILHALSIKRTNKWVPWNKIEAAAIRKGITADRLRVALRGGRAVKFLWLPDAHVEAALREELSLRLGPGFRVDGWLWRPW